jgi:hypothetical protein
MPLARGHPESEARFAQAAYADERSPRTKLDNTGAKQTRGGVGLVFHELRGSPDGEGLGGGGSRPASLRNAVAQQRQDVVEANAFIQPGNDAEDGAGVIRLV